MEEEKVIIDNYKIYEEKATEIRTNLEDLLDFDRHSNFKFVHCGNCEGSLIGHIENKCRQNDP